MPIFTISCLTEYSIFSRLYLDNLDMSKLAENVDLVGSTSVNACILFILLIDGYVCSFVCP